MCGGAVNGDGHEAGRGPIGGDHEPEICSRSPLPLGLALVACGGGDDDTRTPHDRARRTPSRSRRPSRRGADRRPATTEAAAEPVGIASYDAVQPAVVQIVAQGTFRDPEVGFADGSGMGSGFIISPDGLAVTNNHVVAGAATLEVYIGGELDESYNATILGVSECNDLALIDIDGPDDLPHLEWFDGDIAAGLDVYAAGYPLGDPEFTLTRGIIAKAEAGGDLTGTSSIDHTVEHDANIQPGNSGGPLVGADGKVVAVNYAGGASVTTTAQFYGIAADLARPVIEKLQDGDFESLGINGWAVYDETLGIAGIWVAGVAPGSPAAQAEIVPGDIVTSMNGLPVGTDGTFKDYCDVIRTAGEGAPISVEVLRFDTSEVLKGEINGDQPIELAFSFAEEVADEVGDDDARSGAGGVRVRVGDRRPRRHPRRRADGVDGPGHGAGCAGGRDAGAVHRRLDRPAPASSTDGRRRVCCSPSCRPPATSTPRSPSTASPASAPTAGSPTTRTRCSPASTRCGRTAPARRRTSSRWWRCPPTAATRR